MREFVGHDGLLLFDRHPVEKIHSSRFGIVVARNLFLEQSEKKGLQVELPRQQSEFLKHQLGAAQSLRVFVVHVLREIRDHLVAAGQFALHIALNRKTGFLAVEVQDLVHGMEQLFGFPRRNLAVLRGEHAPVAAQAVWAAVRWETGPVAAVESFVQWPR